MLCFKKSLLSFFSLFFLVLLLLPFYVYGTPTEVNVQDTSAPVVTAPSTLTVEAMGLTTVVNLGVATAVDDIDGHITPTPDQSGPFAVGTHTITWSATDSSGNTGSAQQTLIVSDTTAPNLILPPDIIVEATGERTPVVIGIATATDLVDGNVATFVSNFTPFIVGTHTVTWYAVDNSGNLSTGIQTIIVQDTTAPTLIIPPDIIVEATGETTPVVIGVATATDIVDGNVDTFVSNFTPFDVGTHTVTWYAADNNNNLSTGTQTITVKDTTPPEIIAPADIVKEATAINTFVGLGTPTRSDLTGSVSYAIPDNKGPFSVGVHIITWTATDAYGNQGSDTQQVTIVDTTPPVLEAPNNRVTTISGTDPISVDIGSIGVAEIFPVTINNNAPHVFPIGKTTVTWTVTDTNGNTATTDQLIEVRSDTEIKAAMITPLGDSTVTSPQVRFTWQDVIADSYRIDIGTTTGSSDLFQQTTTETSLIASTLPFDGSTYYVRLWTIVNGINGYQAYNDYIYNNHNYTPNHSGNIACEAEPNGLETIWTVNPDNNTVSVIEAYTNPATLEVTYNTERNALNYSDGRPTSVTRVNDYLAVTYRDRNVIRYYRIGWWGTSPYTAWKTEFFNNELPVASVAHNNILYVSLYGTGEVVKIDTDLQKIIGRLKVGPKPKAMALSRDGSRLLVTRFISTSDYGEVYDINTTGSMSFRDINQPSIRINKIQIADSITHGSGVPNYLRGIVISPNDDLAYVTANKSNIDRGVYLSNTPLDDGNIIRPMMAILDLVNHRDTNIDPSTINNSVDLNDGADPAGITFLANGVTRVHSLQGSDQLVFNNLALNTQVLVNTGGGPQDMCATLRTLYVKNYTGRSVSVIDTADFIASDNPTVNHITTVMPEDDVLSTEQLSGLRHFYHASVPNVSPKGNISCASCHHEGGHDGMTWDFTQIGEGLRNTPSLQGSSGTRFGNLGWSGSMDEVQDVERKIEMLFGGEGFIPGITFSGNNTVATTGLSEELDHLSTYVSSLGKQSVLLAAGPCIWGDYDCSEKYWSGYWQFISHGCQNCHSTQAFRDGETHDVATIGPGSGLSRNNILNGIRTPTLVNLWNSDPYLHDGSAATLNAVFEYGDHAEMGLDNRELNNLIWYLNRLGRQDFIVDK